MEECLSSAITRIMEHGTWVFPMSPIAIMLRYSFLFLWLTIVYCGCVACSSCTRYDLIWHSLVLFGISKT
jgi:hypothetical protein